MRWMVSLMGVPVILLCSFTMVGRAADLPGIPTETVTDYIHAVIEADRTFYTISTDLPAFTIFDNLVISTQLQDILAATKRGVRGDAFL